MVRFRQRRLPIAVPAGAAGVNAVAERRQLRAPVSAGPDHSTWRRWCGKSRSGPRPPRAARSAAGCPPFPGWGELTAPDARAVTLGRCFPPARSPSSSVGSRAPSPRARAARSDPRRRRSRPPAAGGIGRGHGRRTRSVGRSDAPSATPPRCVHTPTPARRRCRSGAARGRRCPAGGPLAGDDEGVAIDDRSRAGHVRERRTRHDRGEEQEGNDGGMAQHQLVLCGGAGRRRDQRMPQRWRCSTRPAAHIRASSWRRSASAAQWRCGGRNRESRMSASVIRTISSSRSTASISPTIRRERKRNNGSG
jgi:hypothetical protein